MATNVTAVSNPNYKITSFTTGLRDRLKEENLVFMNTDHNKCYVIKKGILTQRYCLEAFVNKSGIWAKAKKPETMLKTCVDIFSPWNIGIKQPSLTGLFFTPPTVTAKIRPEYLEFNNSELKNIIAGLNNRKKLFDYLVNDKFAQAIELIKSGVDLTPPEGYLIPTLYALSSSHRNEELIEILLKVDPGLLSKFSIRESSLNADHLKELNKGVFILFTFPDAEKQTAWKKQIAKGMLEQAIADNKLDIKDECLNSLLGTLITFKYSNLAIKLIAHGAKVDTKNWHSWTPLHIAAHTGQHDVVQALLNQDEKNQPLYYECEVNGNKIIFHRDSFNQDALLGKSDSPICYLNESHDKILTSQDSSDCIPLYLVSKAKSGTMRLTLKIKQELNIEPNTAKENKELGTEMTIEVCPRKKANPIALVWHNLLELDPQQSSWGGDLPCQVSTGKLPSQLVTDKSSTLFKILKDAEYEAIVQFVKEADKEALILNHWGLKEHYQKMYDKIRALQPERNLPKLDINADTRSNEELRAKSAAAPTSQKVTTQTVSFKPIKEAPSQETVNDSLPPQQLKEKRGGWSRIWPFSKKSQAKIDSTANLIFNKKIDFEKQPEFVLPSDDYLLVDYFGETEDLNADDT